MTIKFDAIRSVLSKSVSVLSFAAISCFGLISEAVGTPIKMEYATLVGHIDPFTYTDGLGTATTGPVTLTLNGLGSSLGFDDLTLGTFTDHLEMTATFDDGRGDILKGLISIDTRGPLVNPEIATIISGVLTGAGAFDGANLFGKGERFHETDPDTGGGTWGYRWPFLVPPNIRDTFILQLPTGFLDPIDIPLSGEIVVTMVPEPGTLALLLLTGVGVSVGAVLRRRASPRLAA